ncbi:U-box-domain-containing protein [Rhizodiscina lignyota]|uniref:U-box-domain-containing protein n=1 Tax=Rhizodiscina lignyota TaxID=1504668 RepID=A0A9P4IGB5_9PEZI|nr:U-box-domain-containing protein [Rhizodiscina lignyota]
MASYLAEQLKETGNKHFKNGDYAEAASLYGQAIQKNSSNPLLYTNRANARLKLHQWQDVIDDCLRSIELRRDNMKAFFYLAQAQLELHHPNEALSSALTAYELCTSSPSQTSSAFTIAQLVRRCKIEKWNIRERQRIRQRSDLLAELLEKLEKDRIGELQDIEDKERQGLVGRVESEDRRKEVDEEYAAKMDELRNVFAIADPKNLEKREVPEYLIDDISFEIMHDPVMTKNGHSYERATLVEHLKRSALDPLTRTPLSVNELRPNLALKKACDDFWDHSSGWAYDW